MGDRDRMPLTVNHANERWRVLQCWVAWWNTPRVLVFAYSGKSCFQWVRDEKPNAVESLNGPLALLCMRALLHFVRRPTKSMWGMLVRAPGALSDFARHLAKYSTRRQKVDHRRPIGGRRRTPCSPPRLRPEHTAFPKDTWGKGT